LPAESARLPQGEDIELHGIGHATLLYHPHAMRELTRLLSEKSS